MVNKRNTLGRGLGSLLIIILSISISSKKLLPLFDSGTFNKDQPREFFDEEKLKELSLSIKKHGIIQPITVKKLSKNKYQLISERGDIGHQKFVISKQYRLS